MWFVGMALAAEPRNVTTRVEPEWATPEKSVGCTAILDVGPDGVPSVRKVRGCRADLPAVMAALSRWRYAPTERATVEVVELSHRADAPARVLERIDPVWASPAEEVAGRTCFAHLTVDPAGTLVGVGITDCDDPAASTLARTVEQWRFAPTPEGFTQVVVSDGASRSPEVASRVNPTFPPDATLDAARCTVLARVEADGSVRVREVRECPEPFANTAGAAVNRWRYEKSDAPWSTLVAVTFLRR